MKIGLHIPETTWRGEAPGLRRVLRDVVETAEGVGFDTIAVADHVWLHPIMGGPLENHTVIGWVVGVDRITPLEIMGRDVIPAAAELGQADHAPLGTT